MLFPLSVCLVVVINCYFILFILLKHHLSDFVSFIVVYFCIFMVSVA